MMERPDEGLKHPAGAGGFPGPRLEETKYPVNFVGRQASHLLNRIQLDTKENHNSSRSLAFLVMQAKTQAVENGKRGVNMGLTKGGVRRTQGEKVI
jgi:hypothetical protein